MKDERDDRALLGMFLDEHSESAFAEIVQRHIDLVYTVALRQLRGDAHLARDATQGAFCELARNARKLRDHRNLSGWLYNTTRFVASRLIRAESRRSARELAYAMNNNDQSAPAPETSWNEVENLLDDAMQDLSGSDREAVLLRYFRNESFGAIGAALGSTENAARMRVERALEKLRLALHRRGVTCPASVLSALLAANAISAAPLGLASAISAPAISAAAAATTTSLVPLLNFMTATKLKTAAVALVLTGTTTGWLVAQRNSTQLHSEVSELRRRATLQEMAGATDQTRQFAIGQDELAQLRAQQSELMRLRAEVTQLRNQVQERAAVPRITANSSPPPESSPAEEEAREELKMRGIARMTLSRNWGIAFMHFAEANNGQMPTDFQQAAEFLPELPAEMAPLAGSTLDYEITFHGRLQDIENAPQAIIMREKTPFHFKPDGSAARTYLFADGHSEIHSARDGNFDPYENRLQPRLKGTAVSEKLAQ
jgi:RNA polymerase sigma factor (sigma-70 family)